MASYRKILVPHQLLGCNLKEGQRGQIVNYLKNGWFSCQINMIFEFLASKSFSVPIYRSLSPLELKLEPKMEFSFFCLSRQGLFLKNGIFREPLGIWCSNFQDKFVFMMVKHGEKMKKSERYGCHALDDLIWIYPISNRNSSWEKVL